MPRFDDPGVGPLSTMVIHGSEASQLSNSIDNNSSDVDVIAETSPKTQDPSPWRSLPSDALERALALLPLPEVFRVRCVCKRWNSLIHCAQFQEWALRGPVPWGPFYSPRVGWKGRGSPAVPWSAYSLPQRKWIPMPQLEFPSLGRNYAWNLMSTDGGLLCFGASDGRGLLVCNPMTNRWKELPSPLGVGSRAPVISHMIVDERRSSYKILFAGNAAYKQPDIRFTTNLVDLYDSVADAWKPAETLSADVFLRSGAYCNGEFYVLTRHFRTGIHAVAILSLTTLRWRDSDIPLPIPQGLNYPYIVACSGHVYLVGGSSEATDRMPMASIGVYKLESPTSRKSILSRWSKVSEYSNEQFLRSTGAIYGCGASGSKIYVVTYAYDMWVAVYNCATGVWEEPIKGNFFDMKDIFETKFSFQPNLRVAP